MADFLDNTLAKLRSGPLGPVINLMETYPRLSAWFVLALGMVIILVIEARDVGLLPGQWVALIVATILVAGACIWIISFEDEDLVEEEAEAEAEKPAGDAQEAEGKSADAEPTAEAKGDEVLEKP